MKRPLITIALVGAVTLGGSAAHAQLAVYDAASYAKLAGIGKMLVEERPGFRLIDSGDQARAIQPRLVGDATDIGIRFRCRPILHHRLEQREAHRLAGLEPQGFRRRQGDALPPGLAHAALASRNTRGHVADLRSGPVARARAGAEQQTLQVDYPAAHRRERRRVQGGEVDAAQLGELALPQEVGIDEDAGRPRQIGPHGPTYRR